MILLRNSLKSISSQQLVWGCEWTLWTSPNKMMSLLVTESTIFAFFLVVSVEGRWNENLISLPRTNQNFPRKGYALLARENFRKDFICLNFCFDAQSSLWKNYEHACALRLESWYTSKYLILDFCACLSEYWHGLHCG